MRSLQRIGRVTVGVSLPRPWVDASGLRLGSPVRLTELRDGTIAIRPEPEGRRLTLTIEAGDDRQPEHLFRRLLAGYLGGAAEFAVHQPGGLSEANRAVVRAFARRTLRPEVLSEDGTSLRLVDLSQETTLPVMRRLARMGQVVLDLLDRAGRTWAEPGSSTDGDWLGMDDEVDRQAWFLERHLAGLSPQFAPEGIDPVRVILPLHIVVRSLERVADHAVQIAEHGQRWAGSDGAGRLAERLSAYHERARALLTASLAAVAAGDVDQANELLDTGEALHGEYRALTESLLHRRGPDDPPGPSSLELAYILTSIDRTVAYAQDIAEAGLDLGVRAQLVRPAPSRSSPTDERGGKRSA